MSKKHCITTALIGEPFGRLTVIGYGERDRLGRIPRLCRCECGTEVAVPPGHLRSGHTRSCGCLERDTLKARNAVRGLAKDHARRRVRDVWRGMLDRCHNPASKDHPRYGGRGIGVCARWRWSFDDFRADMGERPAGQTIDRIDNEGGYWCGKPECPECGPLVRTPNCRWATAGQQANNRRDNVRLTHAGLTLTVAEWAKRLGIKVITLEKRLSRGWSVDRALTVRPAARDRG